MANEPIITLVGNLTDDPALRFLPSGVAVANFTVASTPRTHNKQTDQWEDGEPLFIRASIFREPAENVSESLVKGSRVIVTGRLKSRSYEKDGVKRSSLEMDVDEIGPSLKYATARPVKASKGGSTQQPAQSSGGWDASSPPF